MSKVHRVGNGTTIHGSTSDGLGRTDFHFHAEVIVRRHDDDDIMMATFALDLSIAIDSL